MCDAIHYSNCAGVIRQKEVKFIYCGDATMNNPSDETIQVALCTFHCEWLEKYNQTSADKPLKMRGEELKHALQHVLFKPFKEATSLFTLVKIQVLNDKWEYKAKYFLLGGQDIERFKELLFETYVSTKGYSVEGMFQICHDTIDGESCERVIEIKDVSSELAIEAIATTLNTVYTPIHQELLVSEKEIKAIGTTTCIYESIPASVRAFYIKKKDEHAFKKFENCISFMSTELGNIFNFELIHEQNCLTLYGLFKETQTLTTILLIENEEEAVKRLKEHRNITNDMLLVAYVSANHQLYWSEDSDSKKALQTSSRLVELFIEHNLHEKLLLLAISGERLRTHGVQSCDRHNILKENEFVVKYLVPKHIKGKHQLQYKQKHINALEYWDEFSNKMSPLSPCVITEYFEKNENIRIYLEEHTKGELDETALSKHELTILRDILGNGHSASEFVIYGFPGMFLSTQKLCKDGKVITVDEEYQKKYMPTMHEMYETKKKNLRKGDYFTWKLVNNAIRSRGVRA